MSRPSVCPFVVFWAVELDCDLYDNENETAAQGAGEDAAAPTREQAAAAAAMTRSQTLPPEMLKTHPYPTHDPKNWARGRNKGTKANGKRATTANGKNTQVREHLHKMNNLL